VGEEDHADRSLNIIKRGSFTYEEEGGKEEYYRQPDLIYPTAHSSGVDL
jgi:hypothetical protein